MSSVLIATLGAEPQVVALACQLLLAAGERLDAAVVLHTDARRALVAGSLEALRAAFAAHPEWPHLHCEPIATADVLAPAEMDEFAGTLFRTLRRWLARGAAVHLLLAGGRKPMAMVGLSVAQLLLGPEDRVWYLYSDEALRTAGRMELLPGDEARLIPIPLAPLSPAPPRLSRVFEADTPAAARATLDAVQAQRVQRFLAVELTGAERAVAALAAGEVLTVQEMAARLGKTAKTVTNQLNSVYSKLESAFGLQPDVGVKREFLRHILAAHLPAKVGS